MFWRCCTDIKQQKYLVLSNWTSKSQKYEKLNSNHKALKIQFMIQDLGIYYWTDHLLVPRDTILGWGICALCEFF